MKPTFASVAKLFQIEAPSLISGNELKHLSFDSRRIVEPEHTLFFALEGQRDGHEFLDEVYQSGVRAFVVRKGHAIPELPDAWVITVPSPLAALQSIAGNKRKSLGFPLVGITGSNGKTVVKEWLHHLLSSKIKTGRSPKSYNSQLGLPLSIWQLEDDADIALIEAGISQRDEMLVLEAILKPDFGILTNIGSAHDENFANREEKLQEKLQLFSGCRFLIYPGGNELMERIIAGWKEGERVQTMAWGSHGNVRFQLLTEESTIGTKIRYKDVVVEIPFRDAASVENACTCLAFLIAYDLNPQDFTPEFASLPSIDMRLQLLNGQHQSRLINDAYSADLSSLEIALQFMKKQAGSYKKTLILSSLQSGIGKDPKWGALRAVLEAYHLDKVLLVGKDYFALRPDLGVPSAYFESTEQLLSQIDSRQFRDEIVLVKGRRDFQFERVIKLLEAQVHETQLEIDLNALESNYRVFKNQVAAGTKVMAMVKAQGYGSGSLEIARVLQNAGADYLAVAYTDEGIHLRRNGISLPILIMNAQRDSLAECIDYDLEPVVYTFSFLDYLQKTLDHNGFTEAKIHLEFDTGMHRLGFWETDTVEILKRIHSDPRIKVASVFSHLAASDDAIHDTYTRSQFEHFLRIKTAIENGGLQPLFHILNTAGILRFPEMALDMIRPGIGLYGIDAGEGLAKMLQPVASLKARISQIRSLSEGETVGYGRRGVIYKDSRIGVVSIGYADGYRRCLSNGVGKVWINGKLAPVLGSVCMDMLMVDLNGIDCQTGDAVEIFGKNLRIEDLAGMAQTIPYEIITGISSRVNRVYFRE